MRVERRRVTRLLGGAVCGAMLLSVSPLLGIDDVGAADPLPPLADPTGDGTVCDGAEQTNPFSDLGSEEAGTLEVILCLVATELTAGTSPTTYTPGGTVTRRQMAMFVKRLADLLADLETGVTDLEQLPPYDNIPDYPDVITEDEGFQEAIGQLTQAEIVGGFDDGTFRPGAPVSRRQMAAFVNGLQDFLTGEPYRTDNDYFDDDDGDPGEDDLNAVASVGIFQGNGEGLVFPGQPLSRRQMANILLREAQVLFADDVIRSPFVGDSNAAFVVAPTRLESLVFEAGIDATTSDDDRTYTAPELPDATGGYQVTLVHADNVFEGEDGGYRFAEDGDTGLVDSGEIAARIVRVDELTITPEQTVGGIHPNNGTVTFTVDGDGTEPLVPVVSVDAGSDTRLEIDDQGRPVEAFGVGGQLNYIPAEAGGVAVSGPVTLLGPSYAVVGGLAESTVFFREGDTYRIGSDPSFEEATPSEFQAALSTGDDLRTCESSGLPGPYTADEPNQFCLTDDSPESPSDLVASEGSSPTSSISLAWSAADPADSYNIFGYHRPCADTSVSELVEMGSVPALETSFEATSLDPDTTYCFVVTTVESGDESDREVGTGAADGDNTVAGSTAAP